MAGTVKALWVAAAAAATYVLTLVAAPLLRPDVDVLRTRPEHYANGSTELLVRLGYAAVAVMLLALSWAFRGPGVLRVVGVACLAAGGALSAALAAAPQEVTGGVLALGVVGIVVGPPLTTIALAGVLGGHGRIARVLAAAMPLAFVTLAVAPVEVRGILNRLFDVLLGCWGAAIAAAALRAKGA